MSRLNFKIDAVANGSRARATTFTTLHNRVETPIFMPVGTHAVVRSQRTEVLHDLGAQILLANTYHLLLRPGPEVFERFGGIHSFMKWPRSVLTDSGGFQIFCLPNDRQMTEEGAAFRSYVDGKRILLSPEKSIAMQRSIGSDIMMVLDECVPSTVDLQRARSAMEITHRWARRSLAARGDSPQALFGIVQGACFPELRRQSADFLTQLPFDGVAVGGLAVGEPSEQREDITAFTTELLPANLPRYLMGVGTPSDLLEAVHRGIDMFDCILPGALAQQGVVFTSIGKRDLRRGAYKFTHGPLDPNCQCSTCQSHDVAYLHHLTKVKETFGWQLLAHHNFHFYMNLMRRMRQNILAGSFLDFYRSEREALARSDASAPANPPPVRPPRVKPSKLGDYEVIDNAGFSSIRHISSGETMHSVNDPWSEANSLYIEQSRLSELLAGGDPSEPLTLWDVGLGAATNAMAAIHFYEALKTKCDAAGVKIRPLQICSFENDLNSLRLAVEHPFKFQFLRHPGPHMLLQNGVWISKKAPLEWRLFCGEFTDLLRQAPNPDLVFFDPFSPKTNTTMWGRNVFRQIAAHWKRQDRLCLLTYSRSTAVRAALLDAGFFVGLGRQTGPKSDTTIAWLVPEAEVPIFVREKPLGSDVTQNTLLNHQWLARWEKSQARYPVDIAREEYEDFEVRIRSHPQFRRDGT